jgi:hypothetical protein
MSGKKIISENNIKVLGHVAAAGDIASYLVHLLSAVSFATTTAVVTGVPKTDTHDSGHSSSDKTATTPGHCSRYRG